jgi:hypothetical protein
MQLSSKELSNELYEISKHYRAVLDSHIVHLHHLNESSTSHKASREEQIKQLQISNLIWHLAEIFFFQNNFLISTLLIQWLKRWFTGDIIISNIDY